MVLRLALMCSLVLSAQVFAADKEPIKDETDVSSKGQVLMEPKEAITTGFFDRTLQDTSKTKGEKLLEGDSYFIHRREKYELFLEQINVTYFRRDLLKGGGLKVQVEFMRDFFESKLENLEKKHIHYSSHLENLSAASKENFSFEWVGTYSGKLNGNQEEQLKYAYGKYEAYLFINAFVHQFPLPKVSQNPILCRAYEYGLTKILNDAGKLMVDFKIVVPTSERDFIVSLKRDILKKYPYIPLEEVVSDEYSLENFSREHLNKWMSRIGSTQKEQLTTILFQNFQSIALQKKGDDGVKERSGESKPGEKESKIN